MKEVEDYVEMYLRDGELNARELIKLVQEEAYNQAIDDAIERVVNMNATIYSYDAAQLMSKLKKYDRKF